jgi:hypothetical protein
MKTMKPLSKKPGRPLKNITPGQETMEAPTKKPSRPHRNPTPDQETKEAITEKRGRSCSRNVAPELETIEPPSKKRGRPRSNPEPDAFQLPTPCSAPTANTNENIQLQARNHGRSRETTDHPDPDISPNDADADAAASLPLRQNKQSRSTSVFRGGQVQDQEEEEEEEEEEVAAVARSHALQKQEPQDQLEDDLAGIPDGPEKQVRKPKAKLHKVHNKARATVLIEHLPPEIVQQIFAYFAHGLDKEGPLPFVIGRAGCEFEVMQFHDIMIGNGKESVVLRRVTRPPSELVTLSKFFTAKLFAKVSHKHGGFV